MAHLPDVMDLRVRLFVAIAGAALAAIGWYRYFAGLQAASSGP